MKRALAVVAACGVCGAACGQTLFGTIALTGEQVPGLDPGVRYGAFFGPILNQNGEVAFRTLPYGPGMVYPDDVALMVGRPYTLEPVVRTGIAAPGAPHGEPFSYCFEPALADNGVWSITGRYRDSVTGTFHDDVYLGADEIRPFAFPGDPVPDADPPAVIQAFSAGSVLTRDGAAFGYLRGELAGTTDRQTYLCRLGANQPHEIVITGDDPAPGFPAGVTYYGTPNSDFNGDGDLLLAGYIDDGDFDRTEDFAYWAVDDGVARLLIRVTDDVASLGTFRNMREGAIGEDGVVTMVANVRQADGQTRPVLVRFKDGQLSVLAELYGQVPGFEAGAEFRTSSLLHVFDDGRAVFGVQILMPDGALLDSIWLADDGALTPIAVEGATLPDGNVIAGLSLAPELFHANRGGQMIIGAHLVGASVEAMLVYDRARGLRTLMTTRDSFQVAPGDVRPVNVTFPTSAARSVNSGKGGTQMIDDAGAVVFKLAFGDGTSGICFARLGPACRGDLTTANAGVGDAGYGAPDGEVTAADLLYYVNAWVARDPAADVTTRVPPGDFRYGLPDGFINSIDINFFVSFWLAGCP